MRYFMTGATGFIGSRVAGRLLERGDEVVALVRSPEKARALAERGAELVRGDITEPDTLRAPMEGVDGVFHLAAWYQVGVRDRSVADRINIDGTRNVLQAMRDVGVRKGVYTSTLAVYSDTEGRLVEEGYRFEGEQLSDYDRTKWRAHYDVAEPMIEAGLPLVIVQPGVVYGPGDHSPVGESIRQYLRRRLPVLPRRTAFCWSHAEDCAAGHVQAMDDGRVGESYHLAGPAHTMVEAFEIAERITGIPAPRIRVPPAALRATARLVSVIETVVPMPPTYAAESLRVSAGTTYLASDEKARRELGWKPRSLEDGFREVLPALMRNP